MSSLTVGMTNEEERQFINAVASVELSGSVVTPFTRELISQVVKGRYRNLTP